jgi:hypothetical protein
MERPLRPTTLTDGNLIRAQGRRCYLCGKRFEAPLPNGTPNRKALNRANKRTEDHVTPKSAGATRLNNKLFTHQRCNMQKGARMPYRCELLFLAITHEIAGISP